MPIFAPAYRPTKHQQPYLIRQQKLESKKRKRGLDSNDDDDDVPASPSEPDATPHGASTFFHPVSKTDPYFIAGHPRELDLPAPPFPHSAPATTSKSNKPTDEALASLNPPLYLPNPDVTVEAKSPSSYSSSLKRRHLDNLTTILHRCILNRDWARAERAWALLIRTEIQGRGVDVRRSGRWGIGAELLMRRRGGDDGSRVDPIVESQGGSADATHDDEDDDDDDDDDEDAQSDDEEDAQQTSPFSDEGFQLARDYYDRLILQYPHTVRSMHAFNATAVYPALFNVWIYEVQSRSQHARQHIHIQTNNNNNNVPSDENTHDTEKVTAIQRIRSTELAQALPIAQRLDDLLLSPPYDADSHLRNLRGMLARWIADLHEEMAGLWERGLEVQGGGGGREVERVEMRLAEIETYRRRAGEEREVARVAFGKAGAGWGGDG